MLDTPFTCPNGHAFRANAKLRARCPTCGATAKRDFKAPEPEPTKEPVVAKTEEPKPEPKVVVKKPVLLKQGRPRLMPRKPAVVAKRPVKPSLVNSKVASGLVKSRKIKARGTMPTIKARPIKTAPARGVTEHGSSRGTRPFWHDVADKYGI